MIEPVPELEWGGIPTTEPIGTMLSRAWTPEQKAAKDAEIAAIVPAGLNYADGSDIPEPDVVLDPDETADLMARVLHAPGVVVERLGGTFRVTVRPFGASFLFRDVTLGRDGSADVAVYRHGQRVFRSGSTLSLTGRKGIARTAAEMAGGAADDWQAATFAAVEAVLEAIEQLSAGIDLRTAELTGERAGWVAQPFQPKGASFLIAPGESGKSTIGRALAVSIADGRSILPGGVPLETGPVLYVVSEDPAHEYHARSLEAICKGAGIDRARLGHPVMFIAARGRSLRRLVRSLAERAADAALVILDAQQGFLSIDSNGGIRDQAADYWNAVDELDRPTLTIAHPNLAQARDWAKADGRAAGSEVNRDRPRIAWRARWEDDRAMVGTSFRRYQLDCTKYNHGPRPAALTFAAAWEFGQGDSDPGALRFVESGPLVETVSDEPTPKERDTLDAWTAGSRTPATLAAALGIDANTAKTRIRRLRDKGYLPAERPSDVAA